jgi:O-antigen ligase
MKPLLFLLAVVLVTAWLRGGIGLKVLGGSGYGGKKYIYILGAFMGYFALVSQRIAIGKSQQMVKWYFLSALTFALGNLIYVLGPAFYVLYNFVPPDSVGSQVAASWGQNVVERFGGLGPAATGVLAFILVRWGVRGIFVWNKPWRWLLLAAVMAGGLLSGFRSLITFLFAIFILQFIIEGLWKRPLLPAMILLGILVLAPVLLLANKMPRAVQRSLSFVPFLDINPDVRLEADSSVEWRLQIWRAIWPEVPKYLLLGKGYSLDPLDLEMTSTAARTGVISNYEEALYAGNYHNGLLSLLVPLGLPGLLGFIWLLVAGAKLLYANYRFGDARLKQVNTVLLTSYLVQCLFFFLVYGAFDSQLSAFLGILGFSVSLNHGVRRKESPKAVPTTAASGLVLAST